MSDLLDPQYVRAPDFGPGEWLNREHPLTLDALRGSVMERLVPQLAVPVLAVPV